MLHLEGGVGCWWAVFATAYNREEFTELCAVVHSRPARSAVRAIHNRRESEHINHR